MADYTPYITSGINAGRGIFSDVLQDKRAAQELALRKQMQGENLAIERARLAIAREQMNRKESPENQALKWAESIAGSGNDIQSANLRYQLMQTRMKQLAAAGQNALSNVEVTAKKNDDGTVSTTYKTSGDTLAALQANPLFKNKIDQIIGSSPKTTDGGMVPSATSMPDVQGVAQRAVAPAPTGAEQDLSSQGTNALAMQMAQTAVDTATNRRQEGLPVGIAENRNIPQGMIQSGNIDLSGLPSVKNADGTYSTVRTVSFEEDGKTILLPTIINGKQVSPQEAWKHYKQTGKHLGIFDSPQSADNYDIQMHKDMGWIGNGSVPRDTQKPTDFESEYSRILQGAAKASPTGVLSKKEAEALASKTANQISIVNQLDSTLQSLQDPNTDNKTKVNVAKQLLKVLNSSQGSDAVGVEESRRLGDLLEFHIPFLTRDLGETTASFFDPSKQVVGRDLNGFLSQVQSTSENLKKSVDQNRILSGEKPVFETGGGQKMDVPTFNSEADIRKANPASGIVVVGGKRYRWEQE